MTGYVVSLLMGLVVGVAYGLVQVRSPAPPLIALVGLLGMVLGEQAIDRVSAISRSPSRPQSSSLRRCPRTSIAVRPAGVTLMDGWRPNPAFLRRDRWESRWQPKRCIGSL